MNMIEYFINLMNKAVVKKDLNSLKQLSQTILNFIIYPEMLQPSLKKTEVEKLNSIFEKISFYIAHFTQPMTKIQIRRNLNND